MSGRISPLFPELIDSPEKARIFAEESFVTDVTDRLAGWMQDQNVSKELLATRLGCSVEKVTSWLDGEAMTLREVSAAIHVMGGVIDFSIRKNKTFDYEEGDLVCITSGPAKGQLGHVKKNCPDSGGVLVDLLLKQQDIPQSGGFGYNEIRKIAPALSKCNFD